MRKNEEKIGDGSVVRTTFIPGFKYIGTNKDILLDLSQNAFENEEVFLKSKWSIQEHIVFSHIEDERRAPDGETDCSVVCTGMAVFAHKQAAPKVITPRDLSLEEENNIPPETMQERKVWEAIKKKKKESLKKNNDVLKKRELNSRVKLQNLFK